MTMYKARFFDSTVDAPASKCSSDWGMVLFKLRRTALTSLRIHLVQAIFSLESEGRNERFANITQRAYYQCGTPADPKLAIVHKFDRLIEVGNEV